MLLAGWKLMIVAGPESLKLCNTSNQLDRTLKESQQ